VRFIWIVIRHPTTVEENLAMWWNAITRCQGDHTISPFPQHKGCICRPKDGDTALEALMFVISAAEDPVQNCRPDVGSIQPNESFHAVELKYCGKRLNFWTLSPARFVIVVIDYSKQPGRQDRL
jgi:hypothetical protein